MLPNEPEVIASRLGFPDAQAALDGVTVERRTTSASLGWFGTALVDERGSLCMVSADSPFADLVGDRLRLRVGPRRRSVVVYVFGRADLPDGWDLAVSRRSFLAVARLTQDPVSAVVEVLG